jgi:hypothetical protein
MKNLLFLILLTLSIVACSEKKQAKKAPMPASSALDVKAQPMCSDSFALAEAKIIWTAYKLTQKIGVSGTFDSISTSGITSSASASGIFAKAAFAMPISSINSGLDVRDAKVKAIFFGAMHETSSISGQVKAANDSLVKIALTLNKVESDIDFTFAKKDSNYILEGVLNLGDFQAISAMDSLNQACKAAHTGADGILKMWPDVALRIVAKITNTCSQVQTAQNTETPVVASKQATKSK